MARVYDSMVNLFIEILFGKVESKFVLVMLVVWWVCQINFYFNYFGESFGSMILFQVMFVVCKFLLIGFEEIVVDKIVVYLMYLVFESADEFVEV